jgi:L-threonylcarbamoyladenylate synthase
VSDSVETEGASAYQRFDCTQDDPAALSEATEAARAAIERGECIVLPTDTVYGIGADAFSAAAVQRLLDAKHRGRDMPPPVLIGDASLIRALASDVPDLAKELTALHWPGPLTIICKIQPSLRMDLGDTDGTIALRVPDHELAREVLRRTGPMAVSSANLSGRPAALTCDEAVDQLGDSVSVYLDGGDLDAAGDGSSGAPSTIVDFSQNDDGEVLRHGALSIEVLRQTLPNLTDLTATADEPAAVTDSPADADATPADTPADDDASDPWTPEPDPDDPLTDAVWVDPNQPDLFSDDEDADEPEPRVSHGSTAITPAPATSPDDPAPGTGHGG